MHSIRRSRNTILGIAALLGLILCAPVLAREPDQPIALAPDGASRDETRGCGSVQDSRANFAPAALTASQGVSGPTGHEGSAALGSLGDDTSGYGSSDDRIATALFSDEARGDAPWAAPPERRMPGKPY